MRSERRYLLLLLAAALPVVAVLANDIAASEVRWWPILQFGVVFFVLELFEVELPRGDASTMSTPIVVVSVLFLSPLEVLAAIVIPSAMVQFLGRRSFARLKGGQLFARRVLVTLLSLWFWELLDGSIFGEVELAGVFLLAAGTMLVDFFLSQVQFAARISTPLLRLVLGSSRFLGTIIVAKVSAAVLAYILYPDMGFWGLAVLMMLLLLMRQAFSSYVGVRRAYQSTIEALARTVEAQDAGKLGHAERVAEIATGVGRQLGLRGRRLERLAYVALLHDLGEVGSEVLASGEEGPEINASTLSASEMLREVSFLSDVVPLLAIVEGEVSSGEPPREDDLEVAYTVLVASRTDDMAQGRDTDRDVGSLERLDRWLSPSMRGRIEGAFRLVAPKIQGTLFARPDVGGPRTWTDE